MPAAHIAHFYACSVRGAARAGFLALILTAAAFASEAGVAQLADARVQPAPAANDYVAHILAGISNQGRNQRQPYVTAGDRLPLIEHVFGVLPDAANKKIVLEPHLPAGWEDISIEDLPIGTNLVSFSRTRTGKGVIYAIESKENGWSFVLRAPALPNRRYFLNGRPTNSSSSGIRMQGRKNRVLISTSAQ